MTDDIDSAIAATEPVQGLVQVPIVIASTGRPAIVTVPDDLTDAETIELAAYLLTGLRPHIAANLARRPALVIARGRVDQ